MKDTAGTAFLWFLAGTTACAFLMTAGPDAAARETAGPPAAPPCRSAQLVADGAQRIGTDRVRITVANEGPGACVLRGFPTVALAGQGSPDRSRPLDVVHRGPAEEVRLPVGGRASTELTFEPVLGEADGYCASGAEPAVAPSVVLGTGGAGGLQLGPDDGGNIALCGATVHATAFHGPGS